MSRSVGTKETQGINGNAVQLQRFLAAAVAVSTASTDPCPYPTHRIADWRLWNSQHVVCGVCHPPARGLHVVMVEEVVPCAG